MSGLFEASTESLPGAGAQLRCAQVALEQGLEKPDGLTYLVPADLGDLRVGDRVAVPLGRGNRFVSGYVLSIADHPPASVDPAKLKAIASRDRKAVNLPEDLIELARWISRYYCCPLGMVFATMLPAAVKHGTGLVKRTYVTLAEAAEVPGEVKLRGKQAAVLAKAVELSREGKLPIEPKRLADAAGVRSVSSVNQLIDKGLLTAMVKTELKAIRHDITADAAAKAIALNADQQRVLDAITPGHSEGFNVNLLHGVTGSGKTEVYIRAIEPVVAAGKTAIVLVPEIALTPQTVGRFIGRFERVAVLHSGLTAAQRHEQWTLINEGWAQVVIGARSAIFSPLRNIGLIIVDEEHDSSYKQDQLPRYHARDVAVKRAQMLGATVVLGSATPSLESYYNATERGVYNLLELERRVSELPLPKVHIVDMMEERRKRYQYQGSRGVHLLSLKLEQSLRQTFDAGGQAMLLLNRRGFANYIACPDLKCGWVMTCEHCDAAMVYHRDTKLPAGGVVRCHYCSFENLLAITCPLCRSKVTPFGLGTQRVEDEIARKFPGVPMLRMDSDAMRTAKDYARSLGAFRRGEVKLLVGTQMIAKGLDFPNVRLVGVISADTALSLPDFRAAERTFQLVCQVAGRSGRAPGPAPAPGSSGSSGGAAVIVQSLTPDHPSIQLAAKHDYVTFAQRELESRRAAGLPPVARMARIVLRDMDLAKAETGAAELAAVLRQTNEHMKIGARLIGPMPAPIARIGGYHRQQIELVTDTPAAMQKLLGSVRDAGLLTSDARTAVDVDPVSLL